MNNRIMSLKDNQNFSPYSSTIKLDFIALVALENNHDDNNFGCFFVDSRIEISNFFTKSYIRNLCSALLDDLAFRSRKS